MAHHHHHHRRTLETPDQPSMEDPTFKKQHTKPSSKTTKTPVPTTKSSSFYHLSRLNPSSHKKPQKHNSFAPPPVDIHSQAKSMTVSADFDSSSKLFLLAKSKNNFHQKSAPKPTKSVIVKDASKEKPKKSKKEQLEFGLDMNKLSVREKQHKHLIDVKNSSLGRRRSFGGSQIELADVLANCGVKVVSADMPPFMQIHAVDCARKTLDSLEKFTSKTLALTLKKEFDGVYGPAWHCIVGKSFGSFVTHSVGGFLYFSMDQKLHVLLFKTTVQRADS